MEKQLKQLLMEQAISKFHQKGLDELIVFFIAKYPNFSYIELEPERLTQKYLEIYDISFLASYIRYSELSFLESGIRDINVKEKLCYLHQHIGTIILAFRNFILSDSITLEDLKRWLPLLCDFRLKNRLIKGNIITDSYKKFVDWCVDFNSFAYQNLILLDKKYSNVIINIGKLGDIIDQESLFKLLKIVVESKIDISFDKLLECFNKLHGVLGEISVSALSQYYFVIEEYLREPNYFSIDTLGELQAFQKFKENAHQEFLKTEYELSVLQEFYSCQFLGMHYSKFRYIFPKLQNDQSEQYFMLRELYESRFPLTLKTYLYQKFMSFGNLKPYLQNVLSSMSREENLKLEAMLTVTNKTYPLMTMQNSSFCFISSSIEDYQNSQDIVIARVQSDTNFCYQEGGFISYFNPTFLSCEENACVLQKEGLVPEFLIAFDIVSFHHLVIQKQLDIPIIIIDTQNYAERFLLILEKAYTNNDWDTYVTQKRNFFLSIRNHPWLFAKYFSLEALYEDVKIWQQKLDSWILEGLSPLFIQKQLSVLERLISLNEELEAMFQKEMKASFQYRQKMLQYGQI